MNPKSIPNTNKGKSKFIIDFNKITLIVLTSTLAYKFKTTTNITRIF